MAAENISVRCCIAGGAPAGMMLGYLLARAGVKVLVLGKYGDFLRDFRGATIHPSTLEVMHELGLLDEFLKLPHQKVYEHCAIQMYLLATSRSPIDLRTMRIPSLSDKSE
jgi:2-polyprenyl-6-methoxyphenol hydroxylase-like FAD-dependent oxidoreductase